jgi:hypothetical protein
MGGRVEPRGSIVWALTPPIGRADVANLCDRLTLLICVSQTPLVYCDAGAITEPDVVTVEVLARLRLTARGLGCVLRIYRPHEHLVRLVALLGLGGVLLGPGPPSAPGSGFEARGKSEQREQPLGVQEVVDPVDPPV